MSQFITRDYRPGDFDQVNRVWEETGMGGAVRGDDAQVVDSTLKAGGKLIVLIDTEEDKLIGTSWLTQDARRIYLHHFGILPDYQGIGLSKLLLDESLAFAKKLNMQIKLEVHKDNEIATHIYEEAGFSYLGDYNVYIIRDVGALKS
ncbi:MAG: GNAT family N-acetyltransferase [Bacteroidales bacterium]|nr:GNAT family N-acetyltransferase [Bacteroidales bacterium]MCF8457094.1 GNAT family N-acetyltransferase [Bacteroidales bacterium]